MNFPGKLELLLLCIDFHCLLKTLLERNLIFPNHVLSTSYANGNPSNVLPQKKKKNKKQQAIQDT